MVLFKSSFFGHLVRRIGCSFILGASLIACDSEVVNVQNFDYYPLNQKLVRIYQVTEEVFEVSEQPVVKMYFLKEKISEIELGINSEVSFNIERYTSKTISGNWLLDSLWQGSKNPNRLLISENGLDIVKLILPVQLNSTWNINLFNTNAVQKAKYSKNNFQTKIDNVTIDNVVEVLLKNDSSAVSLNKNIEQYAPMIGLIDKENTVVEYCQSSPNCIGKNIISFGYKKKTKLIKYYFE